MIILPHTWNTSKSNTTPPPTTATPKPYPGFSKDLRRVSKVHQSDPAPPKKLNWSPKIIFYLFFSKFYHHEKLSKSVFELRRVKELSYPRKDLS